MIEVMWKTITGEIKKIFTHKFFIVAIAAVTVVPMLYSYLYLDAFWDPYSRLEKLPVAVALMNRASRAAGKFTIEISREVDISD